MRVYSWGPTPSPVALSWSILGWPSSGEYMVCLRVCSYTCAMVHIIISTQNICYTQTYILLVCVSIVACYTSAFECPTSFQTWFCSSPWVWWTATSRMSRSMGWHQSWWKTFASQPTTHTHTHTHTHTQHNGDCSTPTRDLCRTHSKAECFEVFLGKRREILQPVLRIYKPDPPKSQSMCNAPPNN